MCFKSSLTYWNQRRRQSEARQRGKPSRANQNTRVPSHVTRNVWRDQRILALKEMTKTKAKQNLTLQEQYLYPGAPGHTLSSAAAERPSPETRAPPRRAPRLRASPYRTPAASRAADLSVHSHCAPRAGPPSHFLSWLAVPSSTRLPQHTPGVLPESSYDPSYPQPITRVWGI